MGIPQVPIDVKSLSVEKLRIPKYFGTKSLPFMRNFTVKIFVPELHEHYCDLGARVWG